MLDLELMGERWGFTSDQLMELAGLSCACAIEKTYPLAKYPRILFICGPGNNGGDGLVAARHLYHFGYSVSLYYPKHSKTLGHLLKQLTSIDVKILDQMPTVQEIDEGWDVLGDAIFGFSFAGELRAPFDTILADLRQIQIPISAIDVPSGWDVDEGNVSGKGIIPHSLISLTAPKGCAAHYKGDFHWLGGRFVPKEAVEAYKLVLPPYSGSEQCVLLSSAPSGGK